MTTAEALALEFSLVPRVLLDADEINVLDDGLHALAAIAEATRRQPTVAIVGPSGSGKSWLVNELAGSDVSPTGVLRPTTVAPVRVDVSQRSLVVELVDTPAWEHSPAIVKAEVASGNAVVLVVTPSRYADASVADLLAHIDADIPIMVVMNRVAEPTESGLIEDAGRVLRQRIVAVREDGSVSDVWARVSDVVDPQDGGRHAVLAAAAAGSGRFVAGTVTSRSTGLGRLEVALEAAEIPTLSGPLSVLDDWRQTAVAIVAAVAGLRDGVDHEIGYASEAGLGERFRLSLPEWDADSFGRKLDEWKLDTDAAFIASARIRWRPGATGDLVRRVAWKSAVNPAVTLPPRIRRVMGDRLSDVVMKRFDALLALVEDAVSDRHASWKDAISDAARYTPGSLLGAAEAYEASDTDV